jgi:transposase
MIVQRICEFHETQGLPYRELCAREGISYATFMRWKERADRGEQTVSRPGPKKVQPLDLDGLREQVHALRHGRKRSDGFAELYDKHHDQISRRDLQEMVTEERRRQNREKNRVYHQVTWRIPRLIWAMDDTEYHPDKAYPKAYLHNVQDLGSRFKFEPLVGTSLAHGEEVAAHLVELFDVHGPPLFLKRDNHGNLNSRIVEELLEAYLVIPVNSPCEYPQYNGGIELAQRQIKERIARRKQLPRAFLAIQAGLDVHALNHKRLGCLGNRPACQVFTQGLELARTFNRRKRREVYEWIREKTLELIEKERYDANAAWRMVVETWLQKNGFITVTNKGKVLPN